MPTFAFFSLQISRNLISAAGIENKETNGTTRRPICFSYKLNIQLRVLLYFFNRCVKSRRRDWIRRFFTADHFSRASVTQAFAIVSCRSVSKAENMASHMSFAKHATGALARRLTAPATADLLLIIVNNLNEVADCLNKHRSARRRRRRRRRRRK
jgi:hypothetical protein